MYSTEGEIDIAPRRCGPGPGHALEVRQTIERHVHLAGRAAVLEAVDVFEKVGGKMFGFDEFVEREARIDAGGNCVGVNFVAVGEDDAFGFAVFDNDFRDGGLRANFDSGFAGRVADGVRDCAGAAARESPGAECAVDLSHVVMEQNVGGARRAHAEKCADDARGRHCCFEHVGLEPLIEKINGAHGHELDLVVFVVARHALKAACR